MAKEARTINVIAREVYGDWKNVNFAAKPYLEAMLSLDSIKDRFDHDSAESVVLYFLSNASTWRGETARRVKVELNALLKD